MPSRFPFELKHFPSDAINRCRSISFLGLPLQFVGLEDFIAMKLFAGGPKDLEDVKNVLEFQKGKMDIPLLRRLVERYGREAVDLLKTFNLFH